MSASASGDPSIEDVASARSAIELGRRLIAAGHVEILVMTPDGRAFLFREFVALMGERDTPGDG